MIHFPTRSHSVVCDKRGVKRRLLAAAHHHHHLKSVSLGRILVRDVSRSRSLTSRASSRSAAPEQEKGRSRCHQQAGSSEIYWGRSTPGAPPDVAGVYIFTWKIRKDVLMRIKSKFSANLLETRINPSSSFLKVSAVRNMKIWTGNFIHLQKNKIIFLTEFLGFAKIYIKLALQFKFLCLTWHFTGKFVDKNLVVDLIVTKIFVPFEIILLSLLDFWKISGN